MSFFIDILILKNNTSTLIRTRLVCFLKIVFKLKEYKIAFQYFIKIKVVWHVVLKKKIKNKKLVWISIF